MPGGTRQLFRTKEHRQKFPEDHINPPAFLKNLAEFLFRKLHHKRPTTTPLSPALNKSFSS